jgi:hypothetical protein
MIAIGYLCIDLSRVADTGIMHPNYDWDKIIILMFPPLFYLIIACIVDCVIWWK